MFRHRGAILREQLADQSALSRTNVNTKKKKRKSINITILIINRIPVSIHELIFNMCLQVAYTATKDNPHVFILLF
jgi:hypothetical protein